MSTPGMGFDSGAIAAECNRGSSQRVDSTRHVSRRPIDLVCERIWRDWVRGVSQRSLQKMYTLTSVALDDVLREQAQEISRAARAAAARIAVVLIAVVGAGACQPVIEAEAARVARAFRRTRRSRRRGLEDGSAESVEHARAQLRTIGGGLVCRS
jgi:hypothetical protein